MNHEEVVSAIIGIVTPIAAGEQREIVEDTELSAQLALDSLKVMDLIVAVEDRFDISIPLNALADVRTIGDLAELVAKATGSV